MAARRLCAPTFRPHARRDWRTGARLRASASTDLFELRDAGDIDAASAHRVDRRPRPAHASASIPYSFAPTLAAGRPRAVRLRPARGGLAHARARIRPAYDGVAGRALRRVGAQCRARQRGGPVLRLGRAPAADAGARRQRRLGAVRARARAVARSTSSSCATATPARWSSRPTPMPSPWKCARPPPGSSPTRSPTPGRTRQWMQAARAARLAARAAVDLRSARRLVEPASGRTASSATANWPPSCCPMCSAWASRTSSCCRSPNIRWMTRGATRPPATSRPPAATAPRTT